MSYQPPERWVSIVSSSVPSQPDVPVGPVGVRDVEDDRRPMAAGATEESPPSTTRSVSRPVPWSPCASTSASSRESRRSGGRSRWAVEAEVVGPGFGKGDVEIVAGADRVAVRCAGDRQRSGLQADAELAVVLNCEVQLAAERLRSRRRSGSQADATAAPHAPGSGPIRWPAASGGSSAGSSGRLVGVDARQPRDAIRRALEVERRGQVAAHGAPPGRDVRLVARRSAPR